jgi:DNA polymerase-3 subunit beta
MKFSALKEDLLHAVQVAQYSANPKGMMPILSGVKMEGRENKVTLYSTDLESYTITNCAANVSEDGNCVVNLKLFMDCLKDSKEEKIDVEVVGNEMVLKGKNTVFKLYTLPTEDFPNSPSVNIPVLEDINGEIFIKSVQKVARAASKDEKRPTLLGILLEIDDEGIKMVSTDSYRLAIRRIKDGFSRIEKGQYIIPSSAMVNLARITTKEEKINMYKDENMGQIRFEIGETDYIIRLIEGKFPKYEQFIPESLEKKIEVEKEEILGALKRATIISTTVKIDIGKDALTLESESREVGEGKEKIEAVYDGEDMEIAFNSRFLEEGIISIDGEKVMIGISEPLKPGIITEGEGEEFMYIIMPIRL